MIRSSIAWCGAQTIYLLIFLFGRRITLADNPWLAGPFGSRFIGEGPYEECAKNEGLTLTRNAKDCGLVGQFQDLKSATFDPESVAPAIKNFYERSSDFSMDVWARSYFPMNLGLSLLVTTLSREVNQLNFPLDALETAAGMTSEIVLLSTAEGEVRYRGWFHKLAHSGRVLYTGFYMVSDVPVANAPCMKVVFPMPRGNATVILRPRSDESGHFHMSSDGDKFGDCGFYRVQELFGKTYVWRIRSLKETFHLYPAEDASLRCDHQVRFLGLPVLSLHYKIFPRTSPAVGR